MSGRRTRTHMGRLSSRLRGARGGTGNTRDGRLGSTMGRTRGVLGRTRGVLGWSCFAGNVDSCVPGAGEPIPVLEVQPFSLSSAERFQATPSYLGSGV